MSGRRRRTVYRRTVVCDVFGVGEWVNGCVVTAMGIAIVMIKGKVRVTKGA